MSMYSLSSHSTRLKRQQIWFWFGGCRDQPFQKLPFNYTYIVHNVELKIPSTKDTFALNKISNEMHPTSADKSGLNSFRLFKSFCNMWCCCWISRSWPSAEPMPETFMAVLKNRNCDWRVDLSNKLALRGRSHEHHGQLTQAQILCWTPWWQRNLRSTRLTLHKRLVLLWLYFAEHARGQNFMMQVEVDAKLHTAVTVLLRLCWIVQTHTILAFTLLPYAWSLSRISNFERIPESVLGQGF